MSVQRRRVHRHAFEERRLAHVGRVAVPREAAALGNGQALPPRVAAEHVAVAAAEHVRGHRLEHRLLQFVLGRPDVFQIDRRPAGSWPSGSVVMSVVIHPASA